MNEKDYKKVEMTKMLLTLNLIARMLDGMMQEIGNIAKGEHTPDTMDEDYEKLIEWEQSTQGHLKTMLKILKIRTEDSNETNIEKGA